MSVKNLLFPSQINPVKSVTSKASLRNFIFCTFGTNGLDLYAPRQGREVAYRVEDAEGNEVAPDGEADRPED